MRDAGTKTAAPSAKGNGGEIETIGGGFGTESYRSVRLSTIPSTEHADRMSRVISHAGRLYAVAPFREVRS